MAIRRVEKGYIEKRIGMLTQVTAHGDCTAVFTFWIDHCDGQQADFRWVSRSRALWSNSDGLSASESIHIKFLAKALSTKRQHHVGTTYGSPWIRIPKHTHTHTHPLRTHFSPTKPPSPSYKTPSPAHKNFNPNPPHHHQTPPHPPAPAPPADKHDYTPSIAQPKSSCSPAPLPPPKPKSPRKPLDLPVVLPGCHRRRCLDALFGIPACLPPM